ncbi:MAG: hypothetical protein EAX81_06895 [Candidatus Thorarchaeota archaeon]|nr:hypothetical protein [Candidatus Thorarchaeota archaeon]
MLPDPVIWLVLFIASYIAIYSLADFIIDTLGDISESFCIAPIVLGLLLLGIDLEESIVSLIAAVDGLAYLSLGNLIGNTVIAIGIAFGLPALYLKAEIDQLPRFYYAELIVAGIFVLISMILTDYLFVFGLLSIILFAAHLAYTYRTQRAFQSTRVHTVIDTPKSDLDSEIDAQATKHDRTWAGSKLLLALLVVFLAAEVLVTSAEELVLLTGLNESFFGLIIMAAVTNVEEFWLVVKSIQKGHVALGVSAQVGKILWNTTLIFGLCSLLLVQFRFEIVMLLSSILSLFALVLLAVNLSQNRLSRAAGIGYTTILVAFLIMNSFFAF